MHSQSQFLSLFVISSSCIHLLSHSLKVVTFSQELLIVNIDACHTCFTLGYVTKLCNIDSLFSLHKEHVGSTFIFLFIRLSLVGNALLHAFHIKCFIFSGIFRFHNFSHGKLLWELLFRFGIFVFVLFLLRLLFVILLVCSMFVLLLSVSLLLIPSCVYIFIFSFS